MKYFVVFGESAGELAEHVNDYLVDGWEPLGAMVVHTVYFNNSNSRTTWFFQTIVKRELK